MSRAQAQTAVINGQVRDISGAAIARATVEVFNDATHVRFATETNDEGIYSIPNLAPGTYHIQVSKPGFKTVVHPDITLNVQDAKAIGFILPVGPISDTVTVEAGTPMINTESAVVSTVVDRQFAENLPLNGRSFQSLLQLTPGVVLTTSTPQDSGQFSVNGQRAASNYWMVDGVSANIGVSSNANPGNGLGGSLGSFSALGGTNSLVSVDALQEFRILTSTYAPEFGRSPGGQISILTRSGTNQFHGTIFDYLRNDIFDANNWFNTSVTPALAKAEERQNDFGGTFSGPILKNRAFLFFSYEGLRLRLPQTTLTTVPDAAARQNAAPAVQPFLNAFPLPNGTDNLATGLAQFNSSYSNPATLDAYSVRIDHKFRDKLTLFGRYNYSPSEFIQRGGVGGVLALSVVSPARITNHTATIGATWTIAPSVANDLRFNYSRTEGSTRNNLDSFGGAVPPASTAFPSPYTNQNAQFAFLILLSKQGFLGEGASQQNLQRQFNIVDSLSVQKGSHIFKFGVDYRRLSPEVDPRLYSQQVAFLGAANAAAGKVLFSSVGASISSTLLFRNLGVFAQDTWRIKSRLTVTYGLRWDVDFAPSSIEGPRLLAVDGYNLTDLSKLALAPAGAPPFKTTYGNVAPRLGVAYQISQNQNWGTVLRGGLGIFYDLATSEVGNMTISSFFPFGASKRTFGGKFPLNSATAAPPPITAAGLSSRGAILFAFDPNLKLPYTLEWNVALEQALGIQQMISASYIGANGRRLIQSALVNVPNPNFASADLVGNSATSDYNAFQIQFQRRLSRGIQALASYTWSHSIDTASAGSYANGANTALPTLASNANRGSSDFDIRNAFSVGVTYDIPVPKRDAFTNAIFGGWSLQNFIQVRSALPVNVYEVAGSLNSFNAQIRPDVVSGIPIYLYGSQFPGGKAINNTPGAVTGGCPSNGSASVGPFCPPPTDSNGNPLRQGNLGRNALRGFGATQWDLAVHRDFPLRESLSLQFRAEMFNVLNHPNFGTLQPAIGQGSFGQATQMLGQSLSAGNLGGGAFSPLYQIGGPRSIQFALKLRF